MVNGCFVTSEVNLSRLLQVARKLSIGELERPFCTLVKEFALKLSDRLKLLLSLTITSFAWDSVAWQPKSATARNLFYIYGWNIEHARSCSVWSKQTLSIRVTRDFVVAWLFSPLCVYLPSTADRVCTHIKPIAIQGFDQTNLSGFAAAVNKLRRPPKPSLVKSFLNFFLI